MPIGAAVKRSLRCLAGDRSGVGAIEFAFVVPLLILFVLGGSELGIALTIDRKVKETAGYTSDLVSQSTELTDTDLRKLFGISKATLAPYSTRLLRMRVVQAKVTSDGKSVVDWSCQTTGFEPMAPGTPVPVPRNLVPLPKVSQLEQEDPWDTAFDDYRDLLVPVHMPNEVEQLLDQHLQGDHLSQSHKVQMTTAYVIYAEAEYDFSPVTGQVFTKSITLSGKNFSLPRYSQKVSSSGCATFNLS